MPNTITGAQYGPSSVNTLEDGRQAGNSLNTTQPMKIGQFTSEDDAFWLRLARDSYDKSRNWFDSSIRRQVEDAVNVFNSKHPAGSKYHTASFEKRTKLFRPRSRANARKLEAAFAVAVFSTTDVVSCEPTNKADKDAARAARIKESILRRTLNDPKMGWFATALGLFQAALKEKVCISLQDWDYRVDASGNVIADRPCAKPYPIEQVRIDPGCDWRDPINTSPYIILLTPYYIHEVERQMEPDPRTGKAMYRKLDRGMLKSGLKQDWDSIRNAREGQREDRYEKDNQLGEFQTIWIHRHIVHVDGQDMVFDTVGTDHILMEAKPIEEVYYHASTGKRPLVMGSTVIEAFKPYPSSQMDLGMDLQEEINDIANLSMDTLKLNTTKRYFVRRGGALDVKTMLRNVPGSVVYTNDPQNDVREEQNKPFNNATFEERDRLNTEMDDLTGTFTGSTVGMQRRMNETVGGMNLINEDQNQVQELTLRTFVETTLEPVLRQVLDMIVIYLSDQQLLEDVGAENQADFEEVYNALFAPVNTTVNVGFGNINPAKRMEKINIAMQSVAAIAPDMMQQLDRAEFINEIMGAAGFKDGARFFPSLGAGEEDPRITQLEQQVQELSQMLEMDMAKQQANIEIANIRAQSAERIAQMRDQGQMNLAQMKQAFEQFKLENDNKLKELDLRLAAAKEERERRNLRNQREALSHSISLAEREFALKLYQMFMAQQQPAQIGGGATESGGSSEAPSLPGTTANPPIEGQVQTLDEVGGPPNEFAGVPPSSRDLITSLRQPPDNLPMDLPGEDPAGTLARDEYGSIPFSGG